MGNERFTLALAAWAVCVAGCDAGSRSGADAGVDAASVLACQVPASLPDAGSCVTVGASGIACDPVTNAPCAGGQTCDTTRDSTGNVTGFTCYDGPNDAQLCAPCGVTGGATCAGGLSCASVTATYLACGRFCCADADCGAGRCLTVDGMGRALFGTLAAGLGVCAAAGDGGM